MLIIVQDVLNISSNLFLLLSQIIEPLNIWDHPPLRSVSMLIQWNPIYKALDAPFAMTLLS